MKASLRKSNPMPQEAIIAKLQACKDELMQQGVHFAYLFGSVATDKAGPLSDVDIAVYLDPGLSKKVHFKKRLQCIGIVTQALQRDDIDVVVMNDAEADLVQDVLVHGALIFCRNPDVLADFHYYFTREYLDFAYYREQYGQASLERIKRKELPHGLREKYRQALVIMEKQLDPEHPNTKIVREKE